MEFGELIKIINAGMKERDSWIEEKHSWLKEIIKSHEKPLIYLHEYKNLKEYDFFHTLVMDKTDD